MAAADSETAVDAATDPQDGASRNRDAGRQRDAAEELQGGAGRNGRAAYDGPHSMISVPPLDECARWRRSRPPPPLLTVVLVSSPPLAISIVPPLLMVQWALLALVTVQVPPTTLKIVKPWYCAAAPMELRSNVSEPVPPSWNVLLPESGSTMPLMT